MLSKIKGHVLQKTNILYISSASNIFGAERCLLDIVQHIDSDSFHPVVLVPESGQLSGKLNELDFETIILDFKFKLSRSNPFRFIKLTRALLDIIKNKKIGLVHINLHYYTSNFWLAFLLLRVPVICHVRSPWWFHIFEKFVMSSYFKIICVSKAVRKSFLKKRRSDIFIKFRPVQVSVIYDGRNLNQISNVNRPNMLRKELNIREDERIIALIGAIDPIKGQDILIGAARDVLKKNPKVKFLIIGEFYFDKKEKVDYLNNLKKSIEDFKLQKEIIFTGYRNDIPDIISEIDILIQPSEYEALGGSMLEAMAVGKPVIGAMVDGIPEVIGNNEAGILMPERTPQELAKAINFLLGNPQEAEKKGLTGKKRVFEYFNLQKNIKKLESIYKEAIDTKG